VLETHHTVPYHRLRCRFGGSCTERGGMIEYATNDNDD